MCYSNKTCIAPKCLSNTSYKTVYEICNEPARNGIKLNEQHTGFIMESNDSIALSSID